MKHSVVGWAVAVVLASGSVAPALRAAEDSEANPQASSAAKPLPTLLIKGEVVSLDANDPAATLLKVKDRYGFETPIYLSQDTKIAQGDKTLTAAELKAGIGVEVEYSFDINTAKRHAVKVAVSAAPAPAAAPVAPAAPASAPSEAPKEAPSSSAPASSTSAGTVGGTN